MSVVAAVLAAAATFAGCATDAPGDDPEAGQLVLPLIQPAPNGDIYHLANALFSVTDINGVTTNVMGGGTTPTVSVSLPPGIAQVQLRPGWSLEKSTDGGKTFQPVGALLGSLNPTFVRVLANAPVFVEFDFVIRTVTGSIQISLGIVTHPRELAGGMVISAATDGLSPYATAVNRLLDFGFFFKLFSLAKVALPDGTKQLVYTALGSPGSFGENPPISGAVAAEFYNDKIGTLSGPIAVELAGAFLTYTVAARPDGTVELSGQLIGGATEIDFGPNAIDAVIPTLDADGFPNDQFFYDSMLPFTQISGQGTLTGTLRMRHEVTTP